MLSLRRFALALCALLATLSFSLPALAGLSEDLGHDFASLTGYVIMPVDGEYLIDLDASRGVAVGDLFSVVVPGEPIVHPVTKEVMGTLDEVKGLLRVTRVKGGYSYARPVSGGENLKAGDAIRRYENVRATFRDYAGGGEDFFAQLKAAAPALEWQAYDAAQASRPPRADEQGRKDAELYFILQADGLVVRGPDFAPIHAYSLDAPLQKAAAATAAPVAVPAPAPAPAPVSAPALVVAPPPTSAAIVRNATPDQQGLWYGPDIQGRPVGVEVADFDGDGQQEMAVALPTSIQVGRNVQGTYQPVAEVDLGLGQSVLTIDALDLNGNGRPEIYLTAVRDDMLMSRVVEWQDGRFKMHDTQLSWYLRAVTLPGEGRVLLGQRRGDTSTDYSGPVFRVRYQQGEWQAGEAVSLPKGVSLFGFTPFTGANGEELVAMLKTSGKLTILSKEGKTLWESEELYGGSEIYSERPDPMADPILKTPRYVFIPPRLEVDGKGHLLVTSHDGSRFLSRSPTFNKGRVRAMVWDGRTLYEAWHSQEREGYLSDFGLGDVDNDGTDELVTLVTFTRESPMSKGRSNVVAYDLQ
ncbi:MAG: VCBS repeat-containing protein [Desulfuromonadales bacterium]|nr:VCBS repeat-containing protein [Desulfuromonadales bacterium]MDW7758005.1 VCBS repeat-containing protein [Desulfuromonadales bacterium]